MEEKTGFLGNLLGDASINADADVKVTHELDNKTIGTVTVVYIITVIVLLFIQSKMKG